MPKEIYLYLPIMDFSAEQTMREMNDASDEDITLRINSPGGGVPDGWGIAAKMTEHEGKVTAKVDGTALSMSANILAYADSREALDVSKMMLHRASMMVETEQDQKLLDEVNSDLKKKLKAIIDDQKLKELKGVSLNDLFDTNKERINLWLNANEAKQVGLIDKVVTLSAKEARASFENFQFGVPISQNEPPKNEPEPQNPQVDMKTLQELKDQYPQLAEAAKKEGFDEGKNAGVAEERDRVSALMTYNDVDSKKVAEKIESGEDFSKKEMAEIQKKMMASNFGQKAQSDSSEDVDPAQAEAASDEEKEEKELEEEVQGMLPISQNNKK